MSMTFFGTNNRAFVFFYVVNLSDRHVFLSRMLSSMFLLFASKLFTGHVALARIVTSVFFSFFSFFFLRFSHVFCHEPCGQIFFF